MPSPPLPSRNSLSCLLLPENQFTTPPNSPPWRDVSPFSSTTVLPKRKRLPSSTASPNQRFMVPTTDFALLSGSFGSPTMACFSGSKIFALNVLITPPNRPPSRTDLPLASVTFVPKRDSEIFPKMPFWLPSPKKMSETFDSKASMAFDTAFMGARRMDLKVTFPLASRKMLPFLERW